MSDDAHLIAVVGEVAERLSPGALSTLVTALRANGGGPALEHAVATPQYQDAVRDLREAWAQQPGVDAAALALALACAGERVGFVNSAVADLQGNRAGGPEGMAGDRTGSSRRRWPLHTSP